MTPPPPPLSAMLGMRPGGGGGAKRPRPRRRTLKSVRVHRRPFNRASVSKAAAAIHTPNASSDAAENFNEIGECWFGVCVSVQRDSGRGLIACDWGRSGRELITPGRRPIGVATTNRQPSRSYGAFVGGGAVCCSTFTGLAGMLVEVSALESNSLTPAFSGYGLSRHC